MHFIDLLRRRLILEKNYYDLSTITEFAGFSLIGFNENRIAINFAAFAMADDLEEYEISQLCDHYFYITRAVPRNFGRKTRGRNPNGLLGLIYENGCPESRKEFIKKQTRIDHSVNFSALIVTWTIDLLSSQISVHRNPISIIPPVVVLTSTVYPGYNFLAEAMQLHTLNAGSSNINGIHQDHISDTHDIVIPSDYYVHNGQYTLFCFIQDHFNNDEVEDLCFQLNIDHEELAGETKSKRIRSLISYMKRRGRMKQLEDVCRRLRPEVVWKD